MSVEIGSVAAWNETLRNATASGATVVVDFHASWCGPCKQIAPVYESLARSLPQVRFVRVDVDAQQAIAQKYKVTAMPTFLAIKAGKQVDMLKGADPRGLEALAQRHAGPNPPVAPLPEAAEAAKTKGNALFKEGKFDEAVAAYTEAIGVIETAPLFSNRATALLRTTPPQLDGAIADARKAISLDPKWGRAWVRLGDALEAKQAPKPEVGEAYRMAAKLLADSPQKTEVLMKLKTLESRTGA